MTHLSAGKVLDEPSGGWAGKRAVGVLLKQTPQSIRSKIALAARSKRLGQLKGDLASGSTVHTSGKIVELADEQVKVGRASVPLSPGQNRSSVAALLNHSL